MESEAAKFQTVVGQLTGKLLHRCHMWIGQVRTFVMLTVGNEIPIKKPKTTPTIVTTISLMLSLGFIIALQRRER